MILIFLAPKWNINHVVCVCDCTFLCIFLCLTINPFSQIGNNLVYSRKKRYVCPNQSDKLTAQLYGLHKWLPRGADHSEAPREF